MLEYLTRSTLPLEKPTDIIFAEEPIPASWMSLADELIE